MDTNTVSRDDRQVVIDTIAGEHRALGQVLELVRDLLESIAAGHTAPDFELLSIALFYIEDFPKRCHHPKEDRYLFRAIRRHAPQQMGAVNQLEAEHVVDAQMLHELHSALVCYQAGAPEGLQRLRANVEVYCAMLREHMRKEEKLLSGIGFDFPAGAWRAIAEAFAADDGDPLFGRATRREFERLRDRIRNRLPAKLRLDTKPNRAS